MAAKLLNKTLRIYLLCSIIILIIAVPIFYFTIRQLYIEDVDETLTLNEQQFKTNYLPHLKVSEIPTWNHYTKNVKIEPLKSPFPAEKLFSMSKWDSLEQEMEPYRVLQTTIYVNNKPYLYTSKISLVESEDLIVSIFIVFIVLITLFVVVLFFVTKGFSKKIWQPFHNTLERLKRFELSKNKKLSLEQTDIQEFNELHQSLKKLTDKNLSVYNQQKSFIENASHELQTPLAVLKSKMDMLLQSKNMTNEQAEILSAAELPLSRMTRINKNLLILAKIENKEFSDNEEVDVAQIINETQELLFDFYTEKQITVEKKLDAQFSVICNKSLLEMLISNLLINAIIHNEKDEKVIIKTTSKTLVISNSGQAELNRENLFKRFAISSSETTNSGLGLAIVKGICNRYNWQIQYDFQENYHLFSIIF